MPRIRTIKPEMSQDEELSGVSVEAHLLAYGLLPFADDEGYFNANPKLIKGTVFPIRVLDKSIDELFEELAGIDFVRLGLAPDGKRYGHIVHFLDHQRVSHPAPSKIKSLGVAWEDSTHTPQVLGNPPEPLRNVPQVLRPEGKGIELNRTEGNGIEGEEQPPPRTQPERGIVLAPDTPDDDPSDPPEGLTEIEYARCFWERLGQPADAGALRVTSEAIRMFAEREKLAMPRAAMQFLARAKLALSAGEIINRFWFTDGKHLRENGNGQRTKTDQRRERNREAITAVLGRGDSAGAVAGPDGSDVQGRLDGGSDRHVGPGPARLRGPGD